MKRITRSKKPQLAPEQLENAVHTIMTDREAGLPRVGAQIAPILRLAADLRGLPDRDFKARLKRDLMRAARGRKSAAEPRRVSPVPEGYHSLTTCLVVRDGARAIDFYKRAFGATELMRHPDPAGHIVHAEIMIGDSRIAIADEDPTYNRSPQSLGGASSIVQLYVQDVDALAERAVAAGAKVVSPVKDWFYGDRAGRLQDPFGHLWNVCTRIENVSEAEMRRRMESMAPAPAPEPAAPRLAAMPEGFHSVTPYLQVNGADRLIEFLKRAFDGEEILRVPRDDGKITHAQVRVAGSMIELADASDKYPPNPTAIWLFVPDSDAAYRNALAAGATSLHPPIDQDYGVHEAAVRDPFGNNWYIAAPLPGADPWPPELRSITPYLHPKGTPKVIEFMKRAFGAEEIARHQDDEGTVHHAQIRIGDSIIAMGEAHGQYQPMSPALHLYLDDMDRAYEQALKAGATSISEPADLDYGDRGASVKDPFGHVWYIASRREAPSVEAYEPRYLQAGNIMPFMYNDDVQRAFDLYRDVFKATEVHRVEHRGRPSHVQIAIGKTNVMLRDAMTDDLAEYRARGIAATPRSLGGSPLHLYVYVEDADAAFKRAKDLGWETVDPMADKAWGDRCGGVQDPFGHVWYIATPIDRGTVH